MQFLTLPIPPLLDLVPEQRDIAHHLSRLLIQQKLQRHHAVRKPRTRRPRHEEVHRLEIIREKLRLTKAIPRDPTHVVGEPQMINPELLLVCLAMRPVGDMLPVQQQTMRRLDVQRRVAVLQRDRERRAIRPEPNVNEVLPFRNRDDRHHVVPAVKTRPRPGLGLAHRLDGAVDARARRHDAETQAPHHRREQQRVLHAVAAAAGGALDAFVEQVQGIEADGVVRGIVQLQVLPGDVGDLVADDGG